jgi:hypothetical protein
MLWAFDTEDDSKGSVYWINFFNGVEHVSFNHFHRAVEWILEQRGDFWAVNLEYDLINLFGPLLDQLCVLTYGGFGLLKANLFRRPVRFFNTLRHWPLSVEEMGVRLNYPKLPFDPQNLAYCRRDTEVTWYFIQEMLKRYRELGIEDIKPTLPSTALALFREKFCSVTYFRHPSLDAWRFLSQARYGGRCEVFYTKPVRGTVYEYDINSSYPFAMRTEQFPDLETVSLFVEDPDFRREGVATLSIVAPVSQYPLLPYRRADDGKLLFPTGRFTGTWTYPEIRCALDYGYTVERVHGAIEYDAMPSPFRSYIDFLYEKRQAVKESDPLMSYTLKIAMNATFGKFGEEGDLQVLSRGKRYSLHSIPKHSNMVWAAYILAYGRINLYKYMMQAAEKGELLYVDTDSIFVRSRNRVFRSTGDLGGLAHKGTYGFAHFKLPKLYQVDDSFKAKGIPSDRMNKAFPDALKKQFFYDGIAEFLKPYRWLEAKKLHEQANVWHEVTKTLHAEYDKRVTRTDGRTWPLKIGC